MAILEEIRDRKASVGIAVVVLLVALGFIWSQTHSSKLMVNHTLFGGIGQIAAEETATALGEHGQIMAVIDRTYTTPGAVNFDVWQAFQRELKKHSRINLSVTKSVEIDPNDDSHGCPSPEYKKLMEEYADVEAIVFFVSLPDWKWLQQHQWIPQRLPPHVIVVDTGPLPAQGHYAGYFANGFLSVLIAERVGAASVRPASPKTSREWFDQYFQVFTPQNYQTMAE